MKAIRTVLACIRKADSMYNLIEHGDKIVVGLSGGKDSVVLTYCLHLYQKFSHTDFIIQPVTLNLGFPGFNSKPLEDFCSSLGLKLIVSDNTEVYKILKIQQERQDSKHLPCSICSRMKKAAINKIANEIGFNKVAFAHHADDAIETLFMNEIHGGRIATFSPKMHLENANIDFIRPLIHVRESDIIKMMKEENLPFTDSHCPADKTTTREDIKTILKDLYHKYSTSKEAFLNMLFNYEQEDVWGKEICYQLNQEGLILKPIVTPIQTIEMINVRNEVFCKEQKIDYNDEIILEEERFAKNFLICIHDTTIGCIRYRKIDDKFKIERFAIYKEYRNKGYGKLAFQFLTNMIIEANTPCTIYLNSQSYIKDFYKKFGFTEEGQEFTEAGIKHILMKKEA